MSNFSPNDNHPPKGSSIRVEPLRKKQHIAAIKKLLRDDARNLAIFTLGINTNLRASDLLRITLGQVRNLQPGDSFYLTEKKTSKKRAVTLNAASVRAIQDYLEVRRHTTDKTPLFLSRKASNQAITVSHLNRLVKEWCLTVKARGNFGSHTLRKTFGYQHRKMGTDIPTLMVAFNHSSQKQTLDYLGISPDEIKQAFMREI